MSHFSDYARHPKTGKIELANFIDDFFGKHRYGVRFPSDNTTYDPDVHNIERVKPEATTKGVKDNA